MHPKAISKEYYNKRKFYKKIIGYINQWKFIIEYPKRSFTQTKEKSNMNDSNSSIDFPKKNKNKQKRGNCIPQIIS